MNILILAHRVPYPPNKGEKIRTFNQLRFLRDHGHTVSLATLLQDEGDSAALASLASLHGVRSLSAPAKPSWLRYLRSLLQGWPLSVGHFHSSALLRQVQALMKSQHFDAVLCTGSAMAAYATDSVDAGSNAVRPRLLMDFMDLDSDKWRQYAVSNRFPMSAVYRREARLLALHEQRVYRDFDTCFFISRNEVELFGTLFDMTERKVQVMPNGVDTESFPPGEKRCSNRPPELLFTGVMDYYPNVDAMITFVRETWPQLIEALPGARLTIAGMNPLASITALDACEGVEVTGFVDDMLPYYHRADIFIAPFRIARGVQNKTLQSFAVGLPVITTAIGAEGIDCRDGEHLLIGETAEEFIAHVQALVSDPQLYDALRRQALELIHEHYAWESCNSPLAVALAA